MSKPNRIEPVRLPDGKFITPNPPVGGCWMTTTDGALQPRDKETAAAAGLAWPEPVAPVVPSVAAAPVAPALAADKAPSVAAPVTNPK